MNLQQMRLYRGEWAKARAALNKQGRARTPETEEYERMRIHEEVTGLRCSSKALTNEQLDHVLAAFYVISADLEAHLDAKAQPETRCRYLVDDILDRISAILIAFDRPKEAVERGPGRDGHILYLARRFTKRPLHGGLAEIDLPTWYKLIAAYRYRYDQVLRKKPGKGAKKSRPFDTAARRPGKGSTKRQPRNVAVN